ncbi:MAG TPA: F0F1 ATP synthase subunit epsilon [Streptosporangiaceae bacterium]
MTLQVELVAPDGEIWAGNARMVIAKTLDGDIGIMGSHPSVLGILAEGSVVEIRDPEEGPGAQDPIVRVAVRSGFLSVHDDRVSILVRQAELGSRVDRASVQAELDAALSEAEAGGEEESAEVKYSRALLRAAGDGS